jgi:hypothetical protein
VPVMRRSDFARSLELQCPLYRLIHQAAFVPVNPIRRVRVFPESLVRQPTIFPCFCLIHQVMILHLHAWSIRHEHPCAASVQPCLPAEKKFTGLTCGSNPIITLARVRNRLQRCSREGGIRGQSLRPLSLNIRNVVILQAGGQVRHLESSWFPQHSPIYSSFE